MYNLFHLFLYCAIVAAVLTIVWKCTFAPYKRRFSELEEDEFDHQEDEFDQQMSTEESAEEVDVEDMS
tara:strand:- start:754 stop:957 length:204 start_codon:yes stop_codon:yes gene_type:complete